MYSHSSLILTPALAPKYQWYSDVVSYILNSLLVFSDWCYRKLNTIWSLNFSLKRLSPQVSQAAEQNHWTPESQVEPKLPVMTFYTSDGKDWLRPNSLSLHLLICFTRITQGFFEDVLVRGVHWTAPMGTMSACVYTLRLQQSNELVCVRESVRERVRQDIIHSAGTNQPGNKQRRNHHKSASCQLSNRRASWNNSRYASQSSRVFEDVNDTTKLMILVKVKLDQRCSCPSCTLLNDQQTHQH